MLSSFLDKISKAFFCVHCLVPVPFYQNTESGLSNTESCLLALYDCLPIRDAFPASTDNVAEHLHTLPTIPHKVSISHCDITSFSLLKEGRIRDLG